jgi:hypothetical protein
MKRLLAVLAGALGLRALLRRRAQTDAAQTDAAQAEAAQVEATHAEELRTKLAASRDLEADRAEFEGGETPVDRAPDPAPGDVAVRRADVHARARQAMDDLKPS